MICPACRGNTVQPIRDENGRRIGVRVCHECGGERNFKILRLRGMHASFNTLDFTNHEM